MKNKDGKRRSSKCGWSFLTRTQARQIKSFCTRGCKGAKADPCNDVFESFNSHCAPAPGAPEVNMTNFLERVTDAYCFALLSNIFNDIAVEEDDKQVSIFCRAFCARAVEDTSALRKLVQRDEHKFADSQPELQRLLSAIDGSIDQIHLNRGVTVYQDAANHASAPPILDDGIPLNDGVRNLIQREEHKLTDAQPERQRYVDMSQDAADHVSLTSILHDVVSLDDGVPGCDLCEKTEIYTIFRCKVLQMLNKTMSSANKIDQNTCVVCAYIVENLPRIKLSANGQPKSSTEVKGKYLSCLKS